MAQIYSKKLSYIGENIKKIRQVKRISQADFAALFKLSRPSVGAYEEGRSEPKIDTLIQIANYFRISIDALLTRKLTVSEIFSISSLNEKLNKAHQIDPSSEGKNASSLPAVKLVKVDQYLDYLVNFRNGDFIQNLPSISMPVNGPEMHRAFEMSGSEMEYHQQGLHHRDILMGRKTDLQETDKENGKIITVIHKAGITTRRLGPTATDRITLLSDDPNYPKMDIVSESIYEIWLIESVYTSYLNPPDLIGERILKLEKDIKTLNDKLQ